MTIAVTGATGQLGRLVITKLKEKTPRVRISSRWPVTPRRPPTSASLCARPTMRSPKR